MPYFLNLATPQIQISLLAHSVPDFLFTENNIFRMHTLSYLLYTGRPIDVQFSYINKMEPSVTMRFRRVREIAEIDY